MKHLPMLLLVACAAPVVRDAVRSPVRDSMRHEEEEGAHVLRWGDELFTRVHYRAEPRPYLYPLHAPGGVPVTRAWPQEEGEGEERDHPHHTSFWFAHGDVNGTDFWHPQSEHGGVIELTGELKEVVSRGKRVRLRHEYEWKDREGRVLLRERRTLLLGGEDDQRWIDARFELTAAQDEVTFGDTKEGTFALRLHPALRLNGKVATGSARNSEGVESKAVWGKRAAWVHYQGVVEDSPVGVAVFDHPENLRHPTWWHARAYGLVGANPFGVHDFEDREPGTGDHTLAEGETLVLRYRVWIHAGHRSPEETDAAFEVYRVQSRKM